MSIDYKANDDNRDNDVDQIIRKCINQRSPKSFFLFAGAGSGKTKSLIDALNFMKQEYGDQFIAKKQNVAVITYTNAACDEIKRRSLYNPLFQIATIHSFAWTLIQHYTTDIKLFLTQDLSKRIEENEAKQESGRKTSKAYRDREKKIIAYRERIGNLKKIQKFTYNPEGMNTEKNSLDHAEVLRICTYFLTSKNTFQEIVIDRFPVLLIDESQDTKKELLDAFLALEDKYKGRFLIGLLGDVMQRIYLDGKERIQDSIPPDWVRPCKRMNHRSRKRIVDLCNDIRKQTDGIEQESRHDKPGGIVRVFIAGKDSDTAKTETIAQEQMSHFADDENWNQTEKNKHLTLEHHMAAKRLGFDSFFSPLYRISEYKQGVGDGSLSVLSPLLKIVLPLYQAHDEKNEFAVMQIVKKYSPVIKEGIKEHNFSGESLKQINTAVKKLLDLWDDGADPKCIEILESIATTELFPLPNDIQILLSRDNGDLEYDEDSEDTLSQRIDALENAMQVPFSQLVQYHAYISGDASFDTHQGVKGLQFERVMVIINDDEAQGSTFNYEKLWGITEKSPTDISNEQQGKETTIDRTRRLLYVTCSRAIDGLAIVFYTDDLDAAYTQIVNCGWFFEEEVIRIT